MSASLDALIAERLGISEEQARDLLRAMLEEIRNRATDDGIRLPLLGTFREQDGTLSFSASPSLERLVNQQYEGLQSEEVPAPSEDEPGAPEHEQPEQDQVDRPAAEEKEKQPLAEPGESEPPQRTPDYPLVEDDLRYDSGQPAPTDTDRDEDESEFQAPADGPSDADESDQASEEPDERQPARRTSTADSFQVILGVLLLIFLVLAGWFVLSQTRVLSSWQSAETQPTTSPGGEADTTVAELDDEVASREDTTTEQSQAARFPGTTPGGDEPSDAVRPGAGGWTIVVASTPDRAIAEETRDRYRQQFSTTGLPVDVLTGTVNNATRYRVAVGQYTSREAVLQALDQHAAQLPEGAWVLQL